MTLAYADSQSGSKDIKDRIRSDLKSLMLIPGLSGHEGRVCKWIAEHVGGLGLESRCDRLGNLIVTLQGRPDAPSVMLFTHMDQLGFVVRKIRNDGLLRVDRVGGVPVRALASQAVTIQLRDGSVLPGVIGNGSHHATPPDQKLRVVPVNELVVDTGLASKAEAEAEGIRIGAPVTYAPRIVELAGDRLAGTSIDDRAGCAVLLEVLRTLAGQEHEATLHVVFSVQEEFNLRGAVVAAQSLVPDMAIQVDIMLATDTPDLAELGDLVLGGGPGISLYSFHGRGTLNGVIPHPAMVRLFEDAAAAEGLPLQRWAGSGLLTDNSYVQLVGEGIAAIDAGIPARYSHSSLEVCDLGDLEALARLLVACAGRVGSGFELNREWVMT